MDREEMLEVIWKRIDPSRHLLHSFSDGTSCYFFKCLKLEREGEKLNLYNTMTELYNTIPDSAVWYAYNNGIHNLTRALIRSKAEHRLSHVKYQNNDSTINGFKSIIKESIDDNIPNLNLIKEDYESKQREDRQAV